MLALILLTYHTPSTHISIYTSAPFLGMPHDCSCYYSPLHTVLLTYSSFAFCHSLSLLTLHYEVMWQLSESNKSAAPSLMNPAWETRAMCTICSMVWRSTLQCHPHQGAPSLVKWGEAKKTTVKPVALVFCSTLCQES